MSGASTGEAESMAWTETGRAAIVAVRKGLVAGFERTTTANGWRIAAMLTILTLVTGVLAAEIAAAKPLGLGPSPPVLISFVIALAALLAGVVVAIRTFVTDETETIPEEFFTRRLVYVIGNLLLGAVVFAIVLAFAAVFGLVLFEMATLFVGGILLTLMQWLGVLVLAVSATFLLVTFFFWWVTVVVEDMDFVESVGVSWRLTEGYRLALLALLAVLAALWGVVGFVTNVLAAQGTFVVAFVVAGLLAGPLLAFYSATVANLYRTLRGDVSIPGV